MHRILIAEDEAILLQNAAVYLRASGYDVDTAIDGLVALKKLQEHHYDLLILDDHLPHMSGTELIAEISSDKKNSLLFLFISAYPMELQRMFGTDRILAKPFQLDDLEAKVAQLLE